MALNCTLVLQSFVPQWETRGNDITPLAGLDRHFGGTSMFSKVALMFSSCLKRPLFGEWDGFCLSVMPHIYPLIYKYCLAYQP